MFRRGFRLGGMMAVVLLTLPSALAAQARQVNGRVLRAGTDEPVPAAEVSVISQTTAVSAVTDDAGRFVVSAPAGELTIRVDAVGFASQQVKLAADQSNVSIALRFSPFKLNALVVTGQATTVARRSATTAISYVSGQEINQAPTPSVVGALDGRISGVNIQSNSGAPGGGFQIQVRGNSTIRAGYQPVYVVDGVIYSDAEIPGGRGYANAEASPTTEADPASRIADLSAADIESIEVLKGAAASSIYGSKGANGVVVITTKRGRAGTPRFSVSQRVGMYTPLKLLETRHWTEADAVDVYGNGVQQYFQGGSSPYNDLYGQVYDQRMPSYQTIASLSGGSADTRYYVSGELSKDQGIERNTDAGHQSVRLNLDHDFKPNLTLDVTSNYARSANDRGWDNNCNNFGCMGYAIAYIPSFFDMSKQADGNYPEPAFAGVHSNPLQLAALGVNHEETNRFTGGGRLSWTPLDRDNQSFRLVVAGGLDTFDQNNQVWTPNELFFERVSSLPGTAVQTNGRSVSADWNVNGIHRWSPGGAAGTTFSTSFGLQYEDLRLHTQQIVTTNLLPGQRNVNQGTNYSPSEALNHERTVALYGQEETDLFDQHLKLQGGLRAERSSVNGDIQKFFIYPKISGSYRFMDLLGAGSEVKLRAAYGETGNQPLFSQKFTLLGTPQLGGQQGLTVSTTSGYPNIQPERVKEVEVGLDGSALGDRLTWELTGFRRHTTNLLLQRVPAPSSGFSSQLFNGGKLQNQGVEVGLGYSPVVREHFTWISRATFTRYTSLVQDLAGLPPFFPPQSGFGNLGRTYIQVGHPITQLIGFDWGDAAHTTRASQLSQLGNTAPDFRVGFTNDVRYHALNLDAVLDWQQGGSVINLTRFLEDDGQTSPDWGSDAWQARYAGYLHGVIAPYIESASFVKLREVALDLSLPADLVSSLHIGARSVRVGLAGRNLWMSTKYSGLDPEVANFGSASVRNNLDISPYPPSRSFFLNVTVGF